MTIRFNQLKRNILLRLKGKKVRITSIYRDSFGGRGEVVGVLKDVGEYDITLTWADGNTGKGIPFDLITEVSLIKI